MIELFFKSLEIRAGLLKVKPIQSLEALLEISNSDLIERQKIDLPKGITSSELVKSISGRTSIPMLEHSVVHKPLFSRAIIIRESFEKRGAFSRIQDLTEKLEKIT